MATPPPPPPAPPPPPPPPPPIPPATPAKGGNRTLIIILCVLGGGLLLIGGCVATCTYLVSKKAKEYARSAEKNPQLAAISLAASLHPDIQIVSKDEATGKITLRNKKTGEEVTLDLNGANAGAMGSAFDQFARGMKPATAIAGASPAGSAEPMAPPAGASVSPAKAASLALATQTFPDYLPVYPGATTTDVSSNSLGGNSVVTYDFTTADSPGTVGDFYEKKLSGAGFTILARQNGSNDAGATSGLSAQRAGSPTAVVSVTAEIKAGQSAVTVVATGFGAH